MHDYGTSRREQLAEVAVTMRLHASLNPVAKYREPITVQDVLASPNHLVAAASARLLHHQRWRRRIGDHVGVIARAILKKKPVYILGAGETVSSRGAWQTGFS